MFPAQNNQPERTAGIAKAYELYHRQLKARKIADWCQANRMTAEMAAIAPKLVQQSIHDYAGVKPSKTSETWAEVCLMLRDREAAAEKAKQGAAA